MAPPSYAVEPRPGYDDFAVVARSSAGTDVVALLRPLSDGGWLRVSVDVRSSERATDRNAVAIVPHWLDAAAAARGAGAIEVTARDPHLRHVLRVAGYDGPLRRPLCRPPTHPTAAPFPGHDSGPVARAEAMAAFVQALVPWAEVKAARSGPIGRVLTGLALGQRQLLELDVRAGRAEHALRLRAPDRPDLQPEQVALATDVAATVVRRFPWLRVLALSFDQGVAGLRVGKLGGYALPQARSDLHVNGAYVLDEVVLPPRDRPRQPGFHAPTGRTWVEDVVAHELWHAVEHDFEVRRFRDSMAFRAELGRWFGVETFEHVFAPGSEAVRQRLAVEASGYATENRREATAELFTEWWLSDRPRLAAAAFGALVERYLPIQG